MNHPKADVNKRIDYFKRLEEIEKQNLPIVYVDESGFSQESIRTHGYSLRGKKCFDQFDWRAKPLVNALGALLNNKFITVSLVEGSTNTSVFYAWLTQDLLPKLKESCAIVMDNASFHKNDKIKQAIEEQNHTLVWLPPYSPDLNPIEKGWAWVKRLRRKLRIKSVDELFQEHCGDFYLI